jgi:site-specific DNA-methyltransferase (adenine-specific)
VSEGTLQDVLAGNATWCVCLGDCREVLPTLPDKSVAHVITDPPYSRDLYLRFRSNKGERDFNDARARREMSNGAIGAIDDVLDFAAEQFKRVSTRWMVAFHDLESGHVWRTAFGDRYVRGGVWVKPNAVPQISGDRPGQGFESLTIAHAPGRKRWNAGGRVAVWTHNAVNSQDDLREACGHPCPKPVELMAELVEQFTDLGELVLDPFVGSGTTGVACLRLGRRFIGIERDAKYHAVAVERLRAEERGLSLREARAGQTTIFDALGVGK